MELLRIKLGNGVFVVEPAPHEVVTGVELGWQAEEVGLAAEEETLDIRVFEFPVVQQVSSGLAMASVASPAAVRMDVVVVVDGVVDDVLTFTPRAGGRA